MKKGVPRLKNPPPPPPKWVIKIVVNDIQPPDNGYETIVTVNNYEVYRCIGKISEPIVEDLIRWAQFRNFSRLKKPSPAPLEPTWRDDIWEHYGVQIILIMSLLGVILLGWLLDS